MRRNFGGSGKQLLRRTALAVAVASCFAANPALSNPTGPAVAQGQAGFAIQGNTLTVTNSPGTVINWQGFSIAGNEITRFIQQSQSSSVLNRVVGVNPSAILGALQSNGRVFLVNPNGITIGPGASIDVAGFVASTLNISDSDFVSGRMRFVQGANAGSVVNQGTINTTGGGMVYLMGRDVHNSGIIRSPQGEILLAAGKSVELVDSQAPEIRVQITAPDNQAVNLGQLIAAGGRIGMYGTLVRQGGVASANTAVRGENGKIIFKAVKDVRLEAGSVTTANGPTAGSVVIEAQTGTAVVAGSVEANASSGRGGSVSVTGQQGVSIEAGGRISASGSDGGSVNLQSPAGSVIVAGSVTAAGETGRGGQILVDAAVQAGVASTGRIRVDGAAAGGSADLKAGQQLSLDGGAVIAASGASGGSVTLASESGAVSVDGAIVAEGQAGTGGSIGIVAADVSIGDAAWLSVKGAGGGAVRIEARGGTLSLSGSIDGSGSDGTGGSVLLFGNNVGLFRGAHVNASGRLGGGTVLVGGDFQGSNPDVPNAWRNYVSTGATIFADSIERGDGGKVIIWADDVTRFFGTVSARGGEISGNGGFVEVSGKNALVFSGFVDRRAPNGLAGMLLLDPADLDIVATGNVDVNGASPFAPQGNGASTLGWDTITGALSGGPVTVTTVGTPAVTGETGRIRIQAAGSYNSANSLTFTAAGAIEVNATITNAGSGALTLDAQGGVLNIANSLATTGGHIDLSGSAGIVLSANVSGGAGNITFNDAVTLGANTTLSGTAITFASTVDSPTTARSLTVNGSGLTTFGGAVGGTDALLSLTTNAGGTVSLQSVTTTGAQSYGENATLNGTYTTTNSAFNVGGTTSLGGATTVSTGSGNVTFTGAVDGGQTLAVDSTGATLFSAAVGGGTALTSLTTNAGGTLTANGVTTTGNQTYGETAGVTLAGTYATNNTPFTINAPLTLSGPVTVNAGTAAINLTGTVNGAQGLTLNSSGTTTLTGAVGGTVPLASITTNAGGTTVVTGGLVRTNGAQSYGDPVSIASGPALMGFRSNGGDITFSQSLTGNGGDIRMGVSGESAGALLVSGALTNVDDFEVFAASASVNSGSNTTINRVAFNTTGNVSHFDQGGVLLDASSIGGTFSLVADNGNISQTGAVTVGGAATVTSNRGSITTGGTGVLFSAASATFTANDGAGTDSGTLTVGAGGITATGSGGAVVLKAADGITVGGAVKTNNGNITLVSGNTSGMTSAGTSLATNAGGTASGSVAIQAPVRSGSGNITIYASGPVSQSTGVGVDAGVQTSSALTVRTYNNTAGAATITLENDNNAANSTTPVTPSGCSGIAAGHGAGNCAFQITLETRQAGDTGTASTTAFPGGFAASQINYKSISGTQIIGVGTASDVVLEADSWTLGSGAINGRNVNIVATGVASGGNIDVGIQIPSSYINNNQTGGSLNLIAARNINVGAAGGIGTSGTRFDHNLVMAAGNDISLQGSIYLSGDLNLRANAASTDLRGNTPLGSSGSVTMTAPAGAPLNVRAANITLGTAARPVKGFTATASTASTGQSRDVILEADNTLSINLSGGMTLTAGTANATAATSSATSADVLVRAPDLRIKVGGALTLTGGSSTLGAGAGSVQKASASSILSGDSVQLETSGNFGATAGTAFAATGGNTAFADAKVVSKTAFAPVIGGNLTLKGGTATAQPTAGQIANAVAAARMQSDGNMTLRVIGDTTLTGGTVSAINTSGGAFAEADAGATLSSVGRIAMTLDGRFSMTGGSATASGSSLRAVASSAVTTGNFNSGVSLNISSLGAMSLTGGTATGAAADAAALIYSSAEAKINAPAGLRLEGGTGPFFPPYDTGVFRPSSGLFHMIGDSSLVAILGGGYPITVTGPVTVVPNSTLGAALLISEAPPLSLDALLAAFIKSTDCVSFSGGSCTLAEYTAGGSKGSAKTASGGVCK